MDDLIEALQIFRKYKNKKNPTICEHDILYIVGITKDIVSDEDIKRLKKLSFRWDDDSDSFVSYRFGSA